MKKHALAYLFFALLAIALALPLLFLPVSAECTVHHYNGIEMPMDKVYAPGEVEVLFGNGPANCLERGNGSFTCDDCGVSFLVTVKGACDYDTTPDSITGPSAETGDKLVLTFPCKVCDDVYTVAAPYTVSGKQPASCSSPGFITYAYSSIPHPGGTPLSGTYNKFIEQLTHYYDNGEKVEINLTKVYTMSELKIIFGESLAGLSTYGNVYEDCTASGSVSFVCSGCGVPYLFTATGDHAYTMDEAATKIEEGMFVFTCANSAAHDLTILATAHEIVDVPATCLADGSKYILYSYVDPYGELHENEKYILETYERLPYHTYTGKGLDLKKTYTFAELKEIFGSSLEGLTVYDNMKPTCEKSVPASFKCESCDISYLISYIADHAYSEPTEHEASCTAPGYRERVCETCGDAQREEIAPMIPHSFGDWEKTEEGHARTCTAADCDETESGEHIWDEGTETTPPSCSVPGERTFLCTVCEYARTEPIKTIEHSFGDWEKQDDEEHVHTCTCGETEYAAHEWDAGTQTTPPSFTAPGEMTYTCTVCLATWTDEIPQLEYTTPSATVSVALGERFAIHAKILLPTGVSNAMEVGMLVNGTPVPAEQMEGVYRLNALFAVAVKDADETVKLAAYYTTAQGEQIVGEECEISVVQLLRAYTESENDQVSRLAIATLHYIAAAQEYFDCAATVPVNEGLAPLPATGNYADHYMISVSPEGSVVHPLYFSLVLGDTLGIKVAFTYECETEGYCLAVSRDMDMEEVTLIPLEGAYAIYDGVLPRDFDTTYYFRVLDADGNPVSATFTYGVSTYCARMQEKADTKLASLLDSMLALYEALDAVAQ